MLPASYSDISPSSARDGLIIRCNEATMGSVTHDGRTHVCTRTSRARAYNTIYALPMRAPSPTRTRCAHTHMRVRIGARVHSRIHEWKSAHAARPPFASQFGKPLPYNVADDLICVCVCGRCVCVRWVWVYASMRVYAASMGSLGAMPFYYAFRRVSRGHCEMPILTSFALRYTPCTWN